MNDPSIKQGDENKHDAGKMMWHIAPFDEIEQIIEVLNFGARKYEPGGWKKVEHAEKRYFDALMRHLVAYQKGEKFDEETGLPHLAHAGCNILFLLHFDKQRPIAEGRGKPENEQKP